MVTVLGWAGLIPAPSVDVCSPVMLCRRLVLPAAQLHCVTAWCCLQVAARQLASCKNQPLLTAVLGVISTLCGPDLSGSQAAAVREALLGARPPLLASLLNQVEDHGTSTPLRAAALGELVANWRTWWASWQGIIPLFQLLLPTAHTLHAGPAGM